MAKWRKAVYCHRNVIKEYDVIYIWILDSFYCAVKFKNLYKWPHCILAFVKHALCGVYTFRPGIF